MAQRNRKPSSSSKPRLRRALHAPTSGTFSTARARSLAEALLEELDGLEKTKRLATTRRENPDDDDEDPTRHLDSR